MPENRIAISPKYELPDHPLAVIRSMLMAQSPFPSGYTLEAGLSATEPEGRLPCLHHCVSPDKTRLVVCNFTNNIEERDRPVRMEVWNLNTLKIEHKFYLPGLSGSRLMNCNAVKYIDMLREMCFVGNAHIAVGLGDGFIKIIRISDGEIVNAARIGGSVASLSYENGLLAVSIFPGPGSTDEETAGIKLFRTAGILKAEPFYAEKIFGPSVLNSMLPHEIRFMDQGSHLLCKGSILRSNGYTNMVERVELTSASTDLLFVENDKEISHNISADPHSLACCITGKDRYKLLGLDHQVISEGSLPERLRGAFISCHISPDATKCIIHRNGVAYLFQTDRKPALFPLEMGGIRFSHFISNDEVVCGIQRGSTHELRKFNIGIWPPRIDRTSGNKTGGFEPITPEAFDVALDGSLFISDREGRIWVLKRDLALIKTHPPFRGSIKSIERDPHRNRVAIVSDNQAIFLLSSTGEPPKLRVACYDGKKKDAGSGYSSIKFIRNASNEKIKEDCALKMSCQSDDVSVYVDDERYAYLSSRKTTCEIHHYTMPNTETLATFTLPSRPVGGDELRGEALILLENATMLVFDPYAITSDIDLLEKIPGLKRFPNVLPRPRGMCRISDDRVVAWSGTQLGLIDIGDDFSPSVRSIKDITGIGNVKYDPVAERLMIAFSNHIEFATLGFETLFRLYLAVSGGVLIHVPYPEALKRGLNEAHPGYFWRQGNCDLSAFTVFDGKGARIKDERRKRDFLIQYENEFIVREAITNYGFFIQNLPGLKKRVSSPRLPEKIIGPPDSTGIGNCKSKL